MSDDKVTDKKETEKVEETTSEAMDEDNTNNEAMDEDNNDDNEGGDDNEGDDDGDENEGDDDDDDDDGDDDDNHKGGGKSTYRKNRSSQGRRYTPYPRNNRAVFHQSDDSDPSCRVYVGNLAWEVTWKELKDHMKKCECEIVRADILATADGRSKGCGIVEFASEEGAKRALTLNDSELMGRQIFVREDRENGSGGGYYTQQPGNAFHGAAAGGGRASGGGSGANQECRVYVGNLSWEVSWQDLKDHMRSAGGDVTFAEVMQEPDGRSKGCGVVAFKTSEDAKVAIDQLNDTELKGRMIFVREDRETGGGRGGHSGGHRGGNGTSVYVGNLAYETSWQDLKDHMRKAGNVDQANILQKDDGSSKGCGVVVYQNPRDAARAIRELQNSVLHGRSIFVREDREQGGGRGGFGGSGYRAGGGRSSGGASDCQLFVNNLSYDTNWRDLKDHFRQCGDVDRVDVKRGFGTVRFFNAEDAERAIDELNGVELQGRDLEVRYDNKAGGRR